MKTQLIDFKREGRYKTPQGYMVFPGSVLGRIGVQEYDGAEVGRAAGTTVLLDRPESEVFKPESIASFESMPVTMGHPDDLEVDAKTWRRLAVGIVRNVRREADYLVGDIWIYHADAVAQIERDDIAELSLGYSSDLVDGGADGADFTQTNIEGNHVAVVPRGRCGSECRLGDQSFFNERSNPVKKTLLDSLLGRLGLTKPTEDQKAKFAATLNDMGVDPDTEVKDEDSPTMPIDPTNKPDLPATDAKKVEDADDPDKKAGDQDKDIEDEDDDALAAAKARIAELEAKLADLESKQADAEETRTVANDALSRFKGLSIGDADTARTIREKAVVMKGLYTADEARKLADCDLKAAYQMARTLRDHSFGRSILGDASQAPKTVDYNTLYN